MKRTLTMKLTLMLSLALAVMLSMTLTAMAAGTETQTRGFGKRKTVQTPFLNGTFRALIIGNNAYKDPKGVWMPLKTAINDAEAVAAVLQHQYGFADITLLKNGTRRQMINAFNDITKRSGENDSVLIYYAGHGYLKEDTKEGYWIPVDAEGADDSTFIPNPIIKSKLTVLADKAKHVFLISDSCFSGALLRSGNRGVRLDEKTMRYYQKVAKRKSVQILAAGGLEFVDDNYKGTGHSPFTYYLLEALKLPDSDLIEATELSNEVTRNVAINVNQTPAKGVLNGAGHAGGEFFLIRSDADLSMFAGGTRGAGTATGPKETPRAFIPSAAVTALSAAPAAAAAGGAMASVALWSGVGLMTVSVLKFSEASTAHSEAAATADSDPEGSAAAEADRDSAFSTSLVAGIAGAGMMAWYIWGFDDDGYAARDDSWRMAPVAMTNSSRPLPGFTVYRRW